MLRLHPTKGVALLAVQAFTHSYGQNQRHVRLDIQRVDDGASVVVNVPNSSRLLLPGHYHLFLISDEGVPSISMHCIVVRSVAPSPRDGGGLTSTAIVVLVIVCVLAVGAVVWVVGGLYLTRAKRKMPLTSADPDDGRRLSVSLTSVARDSGRDRLLNSGDGGGGGGSLPYKDHEEDGENRIEHE